MEEGARKSEEKRFGVGVLLCLAFCLCLFFVLIFCITYWFHNFENDSPIEEKHSYTMIYHGSTNRENPEVSYFSSSEKIRYADTHGHVFWDYRGTGTIHTTSWKNNDREMRLEGDCYCCGAEGGEACTFRKREEMYIFAGDPETGKKYGSSILKDRCQRICLENTPLQYSARRKYIRVNNISIDATNHEKEELDYYHCEGYCSPDRMFVDFLEEQIPKYDNNLKIYFKDVWKSVSKFCRSKKTVGAFMMSRDACKLERGDAKLKFEDMVLFSYCTQFTFEEAVGDTGLQGEHLEEVYGILPNTTYICYGNMKSTLCYFED